MKPVSDINCISRKISIDPNKLAIKSLPRSADAVPGRLTFQVLFCALCTVPALGLRIDGELEKQLMVHRQEPGLASLAWHAQESKNSVVYFEMSNFNSTSKNN